MVALISFACGAMVANIYYAQTLIEWIAPTSAPWQVPLSVAGQGIWLSR